MRGKYFDHDQPSRPLEPAYGKTARQRLRELLLSPEGDVEKGG